jgi:predicted transcriptional regulator of viral defense system
MKYHQFKEKLSKLRVFSTQDIILIDENFRLPTLYEWEQKGWVKKIRNKWYVFNDFKPQDYDHYLIANRIYSPSYISLESALHYYGIIPEAVQQIMSFSTQKTQTFETMFGRFVYKSIKPSLFFGYMVIEHKDIGLKVATLEKALLDYLYLKTDISNNDDIEELRFNKALLKEQIDKEVFNKFLKVFDSESLNSRATILLDYIYN